MAFGTISNGSVASTGEITFPAVVGSSVTVTHIGVYDAATSGNLLYHTALDVSKTLAATDTMSVAAGGVSVTLA